MVSAGKIGKTVERRLPHRYLVNIAVSAGRPAGLMPGGPMQPPMPAAEGTHLHNQRRSGARKKKIILFFFLFLFSLVREPARAFTSAVILIRKA